MEFYKPDIKRTEELLRTFDNVCLKLFESSFITAAAVNVRLECLFKQNGSLRLSSIKTEGS